MDTQCLHNEKKCLLGSLKLNLLKKIEEAKPVEEKPLKIGLLFNPRKLMQHTHTAEEVKASIAGLQAYLK